MAREVKVKLDGFKTLYGFFLDKADAVAVLTASGVEDPESLIEPWTSDRTVEEVLADLNKVLLERALPVKKCFEGRKYRDGDGAPWILLGESWPWMNRSIEVGVAQRHYSDGVLHYARIYEDVDRGVPRLIAEAQGETLEDTMNLCQFVMETLDLEV